MDCLQIAHFLPIINYIINCVFLSKMNFGPDWTKQAEDVIFSIIIKRLFHPTLLFSDILLNNTMFQRHLGLTLEKKFSVNSTQFYQGHLFSLYYKI